MKITDLKNKFEGLRVLYSFREGIEINLTRPIKASTEENLPAFNASIDKDRKLTIQVNKKLIGRIKKFHYFSGSDYPNNEVEEKSKTFVTNTRDY